MKVALGEKKAKPIPSKLLKPKTLKASAAISKKKKGALLKAFSESTFLGGKDEAKESTASPTKGVSPKAKKTPLKKLSVGGAGSPKMSKKLGQLSPGKGSLPATPAFKSKALKEGKKGTPSQTVEANGDANSSFGKLMKTPLMKRKSLLQSTPSSAKSKKSLKVKIEDAATSPVTSNKTPKSVKVKTEGGAASPLKANKTPKKTTVSPSAPESTKKSALKRKSVSAPIIASDSGNQTPKADSPKIEKLVSKRKSLIVQTPAVASEQSTTPASGSAKSKKSLLKKKSLAVSKLSETESSGLASPAKAAKSKQPISQSNDKGEGVSPAPENAKTLKKSALKRKSISQDAGSVTSPKKLKKRGQKRKSTPTSDKQEADDAPSPPKVKKLSKVKGKKLGKIVKGQPQGQEKGPKTSKAAKKKAEKKEPLTPEDISADPRFKNFAAAADAVMSLFKLKSTKKELFAGDAQPVTLQIDTFKCPNVAPRTLRFKVAHSIYEDPDICLILGDPVKGRRRDTEQEEAVADCKEMIEKMNITNIKEVIPFNYLRSQYNTHEMKRRFSSSYDVVLCDSRIVGHAMHFLGKSFFVKKFLTPVQITKEVNNKFVFLEDFKPVFNFALHRTPMRLHSKGTTFVVTIGHSHMPSDRIAKNLTGVFGQLQQMFPGGIDNIRVASIKGQKTLPVPVFVSTASPNQVKVPVVQPPKPKHSKPVKDELSTMPGREATVYADGRVKIHDNLTEEDKEFEETMGWNKPKKGRGKKQKREAAVKNEEANVEADDLDVNMKFSVLGDDAEGEASEEDEAGDEEAASEDEVEEPKPKKASVNGKNKTKFIKKEKKQKKPIEGKKIVLKKKFKKENKKKST